MSAACARCATPLERGDLRCAVCALPAPATLSIVGAERARVLRCRACSAAVAFVPDAQAPRCAFCGDVMAIEQPTDPIEEAQLRVPFAVDHAAAVGALRGWLGSRGWFAPRALATDAVVDALAPLYWAAWIVDARVAVTWTADSDAGAERSAWAPHAGELHMEFRQVVVPASRGLAAAECDELAPAYDLARLRAIDAGDAGEDEVPAVIERFDAQRSAARAHVHAEIDERARVAAEAHVPGARVRHVRAACLVEGLTTQRAALPAWVLAYRYRGRPYRAVIHGQRAGLVVGRAPLDRGKVALVVIAALLVAVALVALALARQSLGDPQALLDRLVASADGA